MAKTEAGMAGLERAGSPPAGEGATRRVRIPALLLRWPRATLALLCLALWLPTLLALPPTDRDESRFAQSSKQMLETGDFVDIRFGAEPRYNKPVGIYWLQAATTELAGAGARDRIWTYRLASLIGGILAVWLTWWCTRAFAPPETAFIAGTILAATLLLAAESCIATTDAVLLAATLGMQGLLLRAHGAVRREKGARLPLWLCLLGWASLGASILVKGPVGLGVSAATALAVSLWDRDVKWLAAARPLVGVITAAVVVAPWAIAIALESHGAFYQQSLGHDFAAKLATGQETHGAPPGYYLALITISFWPATLFLLPALRQAIASRREPAMRFLLAWAGAAWLLFEIVPTKLPHYILPVYPALAILCAVAVEKGSEPKRSPSGWQIAGIVQCALGFFLLLLALTVLPSRYGSGPEFGVALLSALAALAVGVALPQAWRGHHASALVTSLIAAVALYGAFSVDTRDVSELWVSPRLAGLVAQETQVAEPPVVSAGFTEPSLVFLLGTRTRLSDGAGAALITAHRGGLALIEDRERAAFLAGLAHAGASAIALKDASGLNYSRGRRVHVTVYRVMPSAPRRAS